jgi:hypothetical protein
MVDTIIAVYSGVTSTLDVTANNTAASGTITNTGNISQTSTAPQLWVGSVATYGDTDGQDTPQNGFTLTSTVPAGNHLPKRCIPRKNKLCNWCGFIRNKRNK